MIVPAALFLYFYANLMHLKSLRTASNSQKGYWFAMLNICLINIIEWDRFLAQQRSATEQKMESPSNIFSTTSKARHATPLNPQTKPKVFLQLASQCSFRTHTLRNISRSNSNFPHKGTKSEVSVSIFDYAQTENWRKLAEELRDTYINDKLKWKFSWKVK